MDNTYSKGQNMYFPQDMTAEDIMEFEYEMNRLIDMEREQGAWWAVNADLQEAAGQQYATLRLHVA